MAAIGRRLLHLVGVMLIVTFAVTALVSMGSTAAAQILGPTVTPDEVRQLEDELGLNDPIPVRYLSWLGSALTGDLGKSLISGLPVTEAITSGAAVTVELALVGLLLALVVAVPAAALAARRPGGVIDTVANAFSSLFVSLPSFVLAIGVLFALAIKLKLFPVSGWVPFTENPGLNLSAIFLPGLVLALHPMATFYRVLRSDMITTLQQDFILTARSKGLGTRYVMLWHAMRPSLTTLVTMLGLSIGQLMTGAVIAEYIFRLPGIGSTLVSATLQKDVPIVQGLVLLIALVYVVVNAVVDVIQGALDPRMVKA